MRRHPGSRPHSLRRLGLALLIAALVALVYQTMRNPNFWLTAAQRGDQLMAKKEFTAAARAYNDPWQVGVAQYRNGDFKQAALTFARVPGATGAFDQGNALLMNGKYDDAINAYDRALGFKPGWKAALDNRALAEARKKLMADAGKDREQESTDAYKPDDEVFDQEGEYKKSKPLDLNGQQLSDAELRATWLRRVQTTPGDFLRAKFAYQAHASEQAGDRTP
jgi:Ca-activated chloride channel family protein